MSKIYINNRPLEVQDAGTHFVIDWMSEYTLCGFPSETVKSYTSVLTRKVFNSTWGPVVCRKCLNLLMGFEDKYVHYISGHSSVCNWADKSIFDYTACGLKIRDVLNASPEGLGQPKADCPECIRNKEQHKKECFSVLGRVKIKEESK